MTYTRVHIYVAFANPFLRCDSCDAPVSRWHSPDACGCEGEYANDPCGHIGVTSACPSWSPVDGCRCTDPESEHARADALPTDEAEVPR